MPPALVTKYGQQGARKRVAAYNLTQAQNAYETALKDYQELSLQVRAIRASDNFDERGYMVAFRNALEVDFPAFVQSFFFAPKCLAVNEENRKAHTFICAGTKSGKSQTMLHLIRHYVTVNIEPALVILDPHGDLANDVARFPENATSGRLVHIKANHIKGRKISFNPFDCPPEFRDESALYRRQKQFLGALEQINGEPFSKAQKPFLLPILGVLLHKEGCTFKDLVRFMDDNRNSDLVSYGKTQLPNEENRDFFKYRFHDKTKESSKEALSARFSDIVADPAIRDFLCNESTFDLPACLDGGKIIVFEFDPDEQSKEAITTIGQLINAYLVSFAMARPKHKRHPIHLFADECQYFVSPTIQEIMGETRKFGLYATLATQRTEQVGRDLLDAILGNVGCYLIGRNKGKTAEVMGKEQPITADEIRAMPPLHFYQIEPEREPVRTKIDVLSGKHRLSGEAWAAVKYKQGELYYRPDHPTPSEYQRTPTSEARPSSTALQTHNAGRKPMFDAPKFTKNTNNP
ncbi:MAG: type IV secretion system DNA-binding domain-containing protein [Tateyamaria sp.]|uniref:type IV secretory system conjugative DNA transfer family protein n=1 Tax=Tateyamaria sp. TaxID=1929288 RepID=UPI00329B82BB